MGDNVKVAKSGIYGQVRGRVKVVEVDEKEKKFRTVIKTLEPMEVDWRSWRVDRSDREFFSDYRSHLIDMCKREDLRNAIVRGQCNQGTKM